jgi:hypothetical protein
MDQVLEFFQNLLSTSDWPPRWLCGKWSEFHGWLYIFSDIIIWLAYFIIPVTIIWFIQKQRNLSFLPVFWLFGAFILLCGTTHLLDAVIFWWPAYRISALVRFMTAIVSMVTIFAIIRDLPKALSIGNKEDKSNEKLAMRDKEIASLKSQLNELTK